MQRSPWIWLTTLPLLTGAAVALQTENTKPRRAATSSSAEDPAARRGAQRTNPGCSKASEVIGCEVRNRMGEELGKIEELVLDPASGSVEYAVISFGGFLGMGDKLFAVPSSLLQTPVGSEGSGGTHLLFDVDKALMEKAPGFAKDNWPDVHATSWRDVVDAFYEESGARAIEKNREFRLCKASEMIGQVVADPKYSEVGKVRDLVLDGRLGRVSFLVLDADGSFAPAVRAFAIPWPALKLETKSGKDTLILDATRERLEKAPAFATEDRDRMSDPAWTSELYRHYGVRPYWELEGPGE